MVSVILVVDAYVSFFRKLGHLIRVLFVDETHPPCRDCG